MTLRVVPRFVDPSDQAAAGSLLGAHARLGRAHRGGQGDRVKAGEPILWLEAMKMQHRINAPADGVIAELPVTKDSRSTWAQCSQWSTTDE